MGSGTHEGGEATYLQSGVEAGWTFVTVEAQGCDAEARQILLRAGAQNPTREDAGGSADEEAGGNTIGGIAPSAVTNAPAPDIEMPADIGGITPSAVTDAAPATEQDTLAHHTPTAPADTTVVSPGMEIPYTQRQDGAGQTPEDRPVTDDDIIAEGMRHREQEETTDQSDQARQPADLDVAPDTGEASTAESAG
jgi:hypothetical protein